MKIFKLDSSYKPSSSIDEFESFIWTERYDVAGDFELLVKNDSRILTTLPTGSLISHTDSLEVMIVENHEIERSKDKELLVKITGRSFETFAENRVTSGCSSSVKNPTTKDANTEILSAMSSSAAAVYILKYGLQPGVASSDDEISNVVISDTVTPQDAAVAYQIKRGDIYSQVLEFLKINKSGIKSIRPNGAQTTLNFVVHSGVDRSASVIFYAQYEDLEDAKYFKSIKGYKNYARVSTAYTSRLYRHRDLTADVTGLSRRVIYEEASDLEGTYSPPTNTDVVAGRGQAALDDNKKTSIIQATISETAKPKFKFDYDVGDLVTVHGEFSASETMRVTEHILTVDKEGIRGYPALSSL